MYILHLVQGSCPLFLLLLTLLILILIYNSQSHPASPCQPSRPAWAMQIQRWTESVQERKVCLGALQVGSPSDAGGDREPLGHRRRADGLVVCRADLWEERREKTRTEQSKRAGHFEKNGQSLPDSGFDDPKHPRHSHPEPPSSSSSHSKMPSAAP